MSEHLNGQVQVTTICIVHLHKALDSKTRKLLSKISRWYMSELFSIQHVKILTERGALPNSLQKIIIAHNLLVPRTKV